MQRSRDAVSVPICRGEEGAKPKGEILNLPVNLHSFPAMVKSLGQ